MQNEALSMVAGSETWGEQRGMVLSKILGGVDGAAYIPPKYQKYFFKYKFLVFPTAQKCLLCCAYSSKVTILSGKLPFISFLFIQTLKTLHFS